MAGGASTAEADEAAFGPVGDHVVRLRRHGDRRSEVPDRGLAMCCCCSSPVSDPTLHWWMRKRSADCGSAKPAPLRPARQRHEEYATVAFRFQAC